MAKGVPVEVRDVKVACGLHFGGFYFLVSFHVPRSKGREEPRTNSPADYARSKEWLHSDDHFGAHGQGPRTIWQDEEEHQE